MNEAVILDQDRDHQADQKVWMELDAQIDDPVGQSWMGTLQCIQEKADDLEIARGHHPDREVLTISRVW